MTINSIRTLTKKTLFGFILLAVIATPLLPAPKASALSGADFKAGRIIDDAVFFNNDSMTVQQIQNFLNSKVPSCDRWNSYKGTVYGVYIQAPYTCLKEYNENITTRENNIGRFNADGSPYQVVGGKSAAQIIWDASQTHVINPQVLIVMLQKETGIVTDTWAATWQYNRAMGYACPDSGPNNSANCDTSYYGFYNQVNSAARQLRRYVTYPDNYNFKAGVSRNILYNPSTSCGSSTVYLETQGTAALYNYTPYQPNPAALAVMNDTTPGGTVTCGAYGNRNFFWYFTKWFGPTFGNIIRLNTPMSGIYLIENGIKRPFDSAEAFLSHNYKWTNVVTVGEYVFNSFPTGPVVGLNLDMYNGKVIKLNTPMSGIYLIENGIKRPFDSAEAFLSHNYKWTNVVTVGEYVFNSFPTGPVIKPLAQ